MSNLFGVDETVEQRARRFDAEHRGQAPGQVAADAWKWCHDHPSEGNLAAFEADWIRCGRSMVEAVRTGLCARRDVLLGQAARRNLRS